jgi:bifunctional non-homologous end joining protein LigD
LELDGVLKSWAVPKGPSLDPGENRLAMRTEDHPLDYGSFEGTIPKGEYGGGTVMLWDHGRWIPHPDKDPRKTLEEGHLHFTLEDELVEGNKAVTRWVMRGTQGTRKVDVTGMDMFLIDNGKIREIWVSMDSLKQAQQMGTVPVP